MTIATYASTRPVPLGAVSIFRVTSTIEAVVGAFAAWRRARTTRVALARLSDAQLADIGLRRADIASVSDGF